MVEVWASLQLVSEALASRSGWQEAYSVFVCGTHQYCQTQIKLNAISMALFQVLLLKVLT